MLVVDKSSGYIPCKWSRAVAIAAVLFFSFLQGMYPADSSTSAAVVKTETPVLSAGRGKAFIFTGKNTEIYNRENIYVANNKTETVQDYVEKDAAIYLSKNAVIYNREGIYVHNGNGTESAEKEIARIADEKPKKKTPLAKGRIKSRTDEHTHETPVQKIFRGNTDKEFFLKRTENKVVVLPDASGSSKKKKSVSKGCLLANYKNDEHAFGRLPDGKSYVPVAVLQDNNFRISFIRPPPSPA